MSSPAVVILVHQPVPIAANWRNAPASSSKLKIGSVSPAPPGSRVSTPMLPLSWFAISQNGCRHALLLITYHLILSAGEPLLAVLVPGEAGKIQPSLCGVALI